MDNNCTPAALLTDNLLHSFTVAILQPSDTITENEVQTICTHTIQMQHVVRTVLSSRPIVDSRYFMTMGRDGFTVCYQTANGTRSIVMDHRSTVTDRSVVQSNVVSLFLQEIKYSS